MLRAKPDGKVRKPVRPDITSNMYQRANPISKEILTKTKYKLDLCETKKCTGGS